MRAGGDPPPPAPRAGDEIDVTDAKLDTVVENWFPRFLANGLDYLDVRRTLDAVEGWDDWAAAWQAAAARYAELGEQALRDGHAVTGAEHLRRAALTLQFAQFVLTDDLGRREQLHRRQADLYRRAAPLLRPPARPVEVALDGVTLPGYLRIPERDAAPPLVVLIPGLESTKEQFSTYEPFFLERGLATLAFEGPGQGESRYALPFSSRAYGRAMQALAARIATLPAVDAGRVAVVGTSFGGHLALRYASLFPGLRGVVDISGPYDLADFRALQPVVQDGFVDLVGAGSREEAARALADVTLDGALEDLRAPVLILHGERDRIVPSGNARRIAAALGDRAELRLEPEGSHSCNNLHIVIRPAVADWVCDRLA
jgi:2,6-dihydroxypseudooxynicotine hydrolase